jgi:hypothetical protein
MGFKIKIFSLLLGILFIVVVVRFIKKNTISPSFVFLWLLVCFFLISVPIFEDFYVFLAHNIFGFDNAANIIYIIILGFLLIYILYITLQMNRISDQIHILISQTAILEKEIEELKGRVKRGIT